MFLKEALSILAFSLATLSIAGFAVKINKFEYNFLASNKLNLSLGSFEKLNLKRGDNFYYFEEEKAKLSKIMDIKVVNPKAVNEPEYIQLSLEPKMVEKWNYQTNNELNNSKKIIKYFLESKPFWINLFG